MSLKPIIKSAREALDRKDYAYALQLCTDALAFEPENYWLLVFKAVALGGEGKSELALSEYSKAARVQTDNPTAFQGIVNLYESKNLELDERYHSALESLNSILYTQKECEKHLALMRKRLNLYKETKDTANCLKILNWLSGSEAESFYPPTILPSKSALWQESFDLLAPIEAAQIAKDIENGRMRASASDPVERLIDRVHVQNYSRDLTQIIRNLTSVKPQKFIDLLSKRLLKIVLSDFCVSEELRREYSQELLDLLDKHQSFPVIDFIKYNLNRSEERVTYDECEGPRNVLDSLKEAAIIEDYATVLKLFNELEIVSKKWSRAFQVNEDPLALSTALKLKLKALISLNYFEDALELISKLSDDDLMDDLLFEPVISVLEEGTAELSRAIALIEAKLMKIDPEHPDLILRLASNLIKAQRYSEASEYLKVIPEAYPSLDPLTEARLSFSTGLCAWHTENLTKTTLEHFLNAAKLNPNESKHFEWIGKFYWTVEGDVERAQKCFTKALNLDPNNLQAAILFSEVTLNKTSPDAETVVKLLAPFTKISSQARNRKLFYYHGVGLFNCKNYLESCVAFQSALKGVHDGISDENCLQWLGESYLRSNRLGSAAKTFTRLATISSSDMTAKVGLASVYLKSNNPIDAVDVLAEIKENNSKVTLERAKSFLALARFYLRQGRFMSALRALLNSLKDQSIFDSAEGLRIASDVFSLAHKYRNIAGFPSFETNISDFEINPGLQEISAKLVENDLASRSVKLALAAITKAFKDPENHCLSAFWLQLAVALSACESCKEFLISAASNAIESEDSSPILRSQGHHLQALIYSERSETHPQAQHHFICALKLSESCALWTDFGRFYLRAGDWQLANEAFQRALAVDQEDLVAAFELARCSGTVEGKEAALQVAQRAFTTQPVLFTEDFAKTLLASAEGTLAKYAAVYLHRLNLHSVQKCEMEIPEFNTKLELLNHLNSSDQPEIWFTPQAAQFDCEFLLKRPENEVTQSGWRAVAEGLLPVSKERTKAELEELQ